MPAKTIPAKTRTKPAEVRREELMNAAERLFLDQGFERTTIEEITTGAGVAKGTFYLQFSSKGDVMEALRQRFVTTLLDRVVTEVDGQPANDHARRLTAWVGGCATAYLDTTRLHDLVFVATPPESHEGLTRNVLIDHLTDLIETGCRRGAWSVEDPGFTALFLFSALHGAVDRAANETKPADRGALLKALDDHFRRIIGPIAG